MPFAALLFGTIKSASITIKQSIEAPFIVISFETSR